MSGKNIRIGIFIDDSGEYLKKNIDFQVLLPRLKKLPGVVTVQRNSGLMLPEASKSLAKTIREKKLDRVVIAAASPWLREEAWGDILEKSGRNRFLMATADLSTISRLKTRSKKRATSLAQEIISAASRRTHCLEEIPREKAPSSAKVLVIGAGLTGLAATAEISAKGLPVTAIEGSKKPGGIVKDLSEFYEDAPALYPGTRKSPEALIRGLLRAIRTTDQVDLHYQTTVSKVSGQVGNFTVEFQAPRKRWTDSFGAIVLASGMKTVSPLPSLGLQESKPVALLSKFLPLVDATSQEGGPEQDIAFLMDVESEQGPVTTGIVLRSALRARGSGIGVTVFCRNIAVAAPGLEKLYREARRQGVLFIKYARKPQITVSGERVTVRVFDEQMGREDDFNCDRLVVADLLIADNEGLDKILRLRRDQEDFFQEENVWLYPTDSSRRGIFIAGACREPLSVKQASEEATAVATEVVELLRGKSLSYDLQTASIDEDKCVFCLTCYRVCPHGAIEMDFEKSVARVSEIACQACGICAAECPAKAIQLRHYTDDQLAEEIGCPPHLLIFACEQSGVKAAESASEIGWTLPPRTLMVRVPCVGRVDSALILSSLGKGARNILLLGCHTDNCHYLDGSGRAVKRVTEIRKRLQEAGLEPERVAIGQLIAQDGAKFVKYMKEVASRE